MTAHMPIRLLIAPGLLLVGIGLLLMRGLNASSHWTHLIPGFIFSGVGTGLINPPLASTAIGVVPPERAGMASGINSTFRQIGIATGIAGLGAVFSHNVRIKIESMLAHVSAINAQTAHAIASGVAQGGGPGSALSKLPPRARPTVLHVVHASFVAALNDIFLIGAIVAIVAAALTLVLIRGRDFEASAARGPQAGQQQAPTPTTGGRPRWASPTDPLTRALQRREMWMRDDPARDLCCGRVFRRVSGHGFMQA